MSTELRQRPAPSLTSREDATAKWFWSPAALWRTEGDCIRVGEALLEGFARGLFPDLYFLTQSGATLAEIEASFPSVPKAELHQAVSRLVEGRALVRTLLSPTESFAAQTPLFPHPYGETLLYDPAAYEAFKKEQLNRKPPVSHPSPLKLQSDQRVLPPALLNRRSHREFSQNPLSLAAFAGALSAFRRWTENGHERALYASTGGLYGIDVYVHVRSGRIDGVQGGVYFYDPRGMALHSCAPEEALTRDLYHHQNRPIFGSAAFTLIFVFNPEVTFPVYGPASYFLSTIETGLMLGTLTHIAELQGIGLCPIGLIDFEKAGVALGLNPRHKILHVAECGGKLAEAPDREPSVPQHSPQQQSGPTPPESPADAVQSSVSVAELRRFLSESLPDYMVPSEFIMVDRIPLTPNNKVDREALLKMKGTAALELGTQFIAANDELEKTLVGFWRNVIRAERIGVEDNFFDLGGDSMGVAEIHRAIQAHFSLEVPIVKLFQHPTIRSLASFLRAQLQTGSETHAATPAASSPRPCCTAKIETPAISPADQQALDWLRANPAHPQAAPVAAKLRSRGVSV